MKTSSGTTARQTISQTIATVLNDRMPIRITNKRLGSVIIMPEEDFDFWQETVYLLKSPANARNLMEGIEAQDKREGVVTKSMEALVEGKESAN